MLQPENVGIEDMQCWVFCNAAQQWHMTGSECAEIFKKYRILEYIEECFEILHVSSYDAVLRDVEEIIKKEEKEDGVSTGKWNSVSRKLL